MESCVRFSLKKSVVFLHTWHGRFCFCIITKKLYKIYKRKGYAEHLSNVNTVVELWSSANYRVDMELIYTTCKKRFLTTTKSVYINLLLKA
jgi:hypothetical protein